jgi:outer membrane usher protein
MAAVGGDDLYLEVSVNGRSGGLAHFVYKDGEIWASLATLRRLAFVLPSDTPDPVRLQSLPGLTVEYQRAYQSLTLTAPLALLDLSTSTLNTRDVSIPKSTASPGVLLNYDLYGIRGDNGLGTASAYTELRAFAENFLFSSTALLQSVDTGAGWQNRSVRLDTTLSESFPQQMLTLNVGDTLTAATSWSQSTRIGGVQFGTNFALQPYRITTPLPQFFGQAALPSQLELYINGIKQYTGNVPSGPFQLNTVPGINGAGNAQIVLTNALGQATSLNFSLYNTTELLEKGLVDWSVELGAVRENYGLESFDYGHQAVGSATWRYGLTNGLTLEAHGEATNGLTEGGAGLDVLLGRTGGIFSAALAGSTNRGVSGSQVALGYNWTDGRFSLGLTGQRASDGYRDLAALYGAPPPQLLASANLGYNTRSLGSVGVNYSDLRYQQQPASRFASVYWFRSMGRHVVANFNVTQNVDTPRDRSIFLGVTVTLDERTWAQASVQNQAGANIFALNAAQMVPQSGGFGWRAQAQQGDGADGALAELDYLGRYGQVQAGYSTLAGSNYAYAGALGSVVLMDDHLFAARQIINGFAVVSTDGIANVPVKLENNAVGTTDRNGLLLVTPLNAYQNNKLSIDALSLPADVRVSHVDVNASPTDRAGTLADFGLAPIRAALIILTDAAGVPLPLGSTVRIFRHDRLEPALVGYDGVVYLESLDSHSVLEVQTPSGPCHASVDYQAQPGTIPTIGPVRCRSSS